MSDSEHEQEPEGPVRVNIFGQTYNLRSRSSGEHILLIARSVDERMRQIASHLAVHDVAKVAVLAALNFADELHAQKDYYEREMRSLLSQGTSGEEEAAEQPTPTSEEESEARSGGSWFEAVFDADAFDDVGGGRMSRQLTSKLQERRQGRRERPAAAGERTSDGESGKE